MWEMTSMGEMSAASTTMPKGNGGEEEDDEEEEEAWAVAVAEGDLRSALTTSLTPRLSDFVPAAVDFHF
jgi:hypothetical protein